MSGDLMITAGVDVGSAVIKMALMETDEAGGERLVAGVGERIRRRDTHAVARDLFASVLRDAGVEAAALGYVATTGEGETIPIRTGHFYGMTTHARGGLFLEPEARAIIDMGALHTRAVAMDGRSKVIGYRMTSQCASGSGQFLENIARYLGVSLEEVGTLSLQADNPEVCSSICAVLAETDVINMVSRGITLPNILKGIHKSMAGRAVRLLVSLGKPPVVLVTGGLANDAGLVAAMREAAVEQKMTVDIRHHESSMLAGAIGAALWGAFRARKLQRMKERMGSMIPDMASLLDLRGRVAAVAGGAGAIGSAICARLLECGATIYCLDRPGQPAPAQTRAIACDLTDAAAVASAVQDIDRAAGRLDIVVHAAGITRDARVWKASEADWNLVLSTNLSSAFHLLHAAVPVIRRTGPGSIVLISSINGERGKIGQSSYAASKAGLNALARTAAREVGAFGIRVNAIAPGWITTPMTEDLPDEIRQRARDETPLGRLGEPDDVARATLFLVSDLACHITGQVLRVDGGQLIG